MNFWLIKSEPSTYSIDDLKRDKKTAWEGVRNFQARNHMRMMKKGDLVLFYHSSSDPMCVAGIAKVSSGVHADESQFKTGDYFEPRSTRLKPVWECVDVSFVETAGHPILLRDMRTDPALRGMQLLQKGSRLSVQPVSPEHFAHIRSLMKKKG